MGVAGHVEGALSAEMHGVLHEPLQGEKRYRPGLLVVAWRTDGKWTAVYAPDDAFEPPADHIVVDGFGVEPPGLEPWCIHHETGRDGIQERFQSWRSLTVHNHQNCVVSKYVQGARLVKGADPWSRAMRHKDIQSILSNTLSASG